MNIEDTLDSPSSSSPVEVIDAPTKQSKLEHRVTLDDQPKPPLLNRAQRRQLGRYIRHKAALQTRHVLAKRRRMAVKAEKRAKMAAKQARYATGIVS